MAGEAAGVAGEAAGGGATAASGIGARDAVAVGAGCGAEWGRVNAK